MLFTQTPVSIFKRLYPEAIFALSNPSQIALTFDDGPIPEVTETILDILNKYNVKANFFCVGENIEKHSHIFQKIIQEGHSIGNHTYSHLNGWKTSNSIYFDNIEKFNQLYPTNLFRPPYGKLRFSQYKHLIEKQYKVIFWSVITYDYHSKMTYKKCFKLLKNNTFGGQIILFHDNIKSFRLISKILPDFIAFCQNLNLTFVPLKNEL